MRRLTEWASDYIEKLEKRNGALQRKPCVFKTWFKVLWLSWLLWQRCLFLLWRRGKLLCKLWSQHKGGVHRLFGNLGFLVKVLSGCFSSLCNSEWTLLSLFVDISTELWGRGCTASHTDLSFERAGTGHCQLLQYRREAAYSSMVCLYFNLG